LKVLQRGAECRAERAGSPLCRIIDVLQQVMCTHDAEKLAIAVLEIYDGGYDEELTSK
jgi:hypothetical protein